MKHHVPIKAELFYNVKEMADCDAIFATGWATAYPVFNYKGNAKKYYFLQDYEAMFEPAGTYSALADNTYKMGLHGVSTSPWVLHKVKTEYGMQCDELSLGITPSEYYLKNEGERKKVVFYARPVTPRRGFELGVLAFKLFHEAHPEYEIHCIGWDISRYEIPFPYVNRNILDTEELNDLYNDCAGGLAPSFTSMSLLPVEMMASGCMPVVNKAPYTTMVHYPKYVKYAEPNPQALADALWESVNSADQAKQAKNIADYAKQFYWTKYTDQLDKILLRDLS
jgi:glycosyltransferase involved in cell wall biosynthesis